jgi:hypothetical protein
VAFYGPTADLATKIAVAIIPDESNQPDLLERWFSDGNDIRRDSVIGEKVSSFLRQHKTRSVVIADGILGCPDEEASIIQRASPARNDHTGLVATAAQS